MSEKLPDRNHQLLPFCEMQQDGADEASCDYLMIGSINQNIATDKTIKSLYLHAKNPQKTSSIMIKNEGFTVKFALFCFRAATADYYHKAVKNSFFAETKVASKGLEKLVPSTHSDTCRLQISESQSNDLVNVYLRLG